MKKVSRVVLKPCPNPNKNESHVNSSLPDDNDASLTPKKPPSPKEFMVSVAVRISSQPLPNFDPDVWGVLTAISPNVRKRQHHSSNVCLFHSFLQFVSVTFHSPFSRPPHLYHLPSPMYH
ncbi:hypothetical protein U1Q18_036034 [Sarracenia purpurea var. burkii]